MNKCSMCKKDFEGQSNICRECFNIVEEEKKEFAVFLAYWQKSPPFLMLRTGLWTLALIVLFIFFFLWNLRFIMITNTIDRTSFVALFFSVFAIGMLVYGIFLGNLLLKNVTKKYTKALFNFKKDSISAGRIVTKYSVVGVPAVALLTLALILLLSFSILPKLSFINKELCAGLNAILWGLYLGTWVGFFHIGPYLSRKWIHKINY